MGRGGRGFRSALVVGLVALLAACGGQDVPEGAVHLKAGEPVEVDGLTLTAANFGEDSISLIASDGQDFDDAVDLTVGRSGEVKGKSFELVKVEVEGSGDDVVEESGQAWVLPAG
ncbi:hypothetical protein [Cellulomonas dongxiuzhuiae]|uniref:Lipoprotein n=1 Tax=Cellulomonas dongxiuzhuiae TaxID=2819979 RepID=A0ABX8GGK7_9CELL|nr:hypothetical protein [Cellulomonas dongxiuzhuiae]MBO3094216.1 hypothetical protein [Cellulomonas dongxiuzhuiae]QWC15267.1 hypothetical protein KKR89_13200 [Cellulomonas dongxiuzhuiae]